MLTFCHVKQEYYLQGYLLRKINVCHYLLLYSIFLISVAFRLIVYKYENTFPAFQFIAFFHRLGTKNGSAINR